MSVSRAPMLEKPLRGLLFIIGLAAALVLVMLLFPTKAVIMKILPFDNKGEFQVMINAPEGATLEATRATAEEMAAYLATIPEVTDYQVYAGTSAPFNFNGLVRHYYFRSGPNVADIQVNLGDKNTRKRQSHAIAKEVRPELKKIADRHGVVVQVAEVPPGPPVLATVVAEIYGDDYNRQKAIARQVQQKLAETKRQSSMSTLTWKTRSPNTASPSIKKRRALSGIDTAQVTQTIAMAVHGYPPDWRTSQPSTIR